MQRELIHSQPVYNQVVCFTCVSKTFSSTILELFGTCLAPSWGFGTIFAFSGTFLAPSLPFGPQGDPQMTSTNYIRCSQFGFKLCLLLSAVSNWLRATMTDFVSRQRKARRCRDRADEPTQDALAFSVDAVSPPCRALMLDGWSQEFLRSLRAGSPFAFFTHA